MGKHTHQTSRHVTVWALVLLLTAGCSTSTEKTDREVAALVGNSTEPQCESQPVGLSSRPQEFDFETILADGQTLRHDFTLTNPTAQPLRVLRATAFMSCCSAVEKLPKSIPPRGEAKVSVVFKAGTQSERKRLAFAVETDAREQPIQRLVLSAACVSVCDIRPLGQSGASMPIGKPAQRTYQVICRRIQGAGRGLPESVTASEPLKVGFKDQEVEKVGPGGVIESFRTVELDIPSHTTIGQHSGSISFRWRDGKAKNETVNWDVLPSLRAAPAGLILDPSTGPTVANIRIASDDRPFRILKVTGALLGADLGGPMNVDRVHTLHLTIDPARSTGARDEGEIKIETDHPEQPLVKVSVLVLPSR